MQIFRDINEIEKAPRHAVVTIGNFDGLHLGHQAILERLRALAKKENGESVVLTFKPHPQLALFPEKEVELINTYDEKIELLDAAGVDVVIEQPFSRDFSNLSAEDFIVDILQKRLRARAILLGYDFAFGKGRRGNASLVRTLLAPHAVTVEEMSPSELDGRPISSTRIRYALETGKIAEANSCLGRPFFIRGYVAQGDGRGRKLGIPTANIQTGKRKIPSTGVYATMASVEGKTYRAVTNIGHRPTFRGQTSSASTIETHLLDFSGNDFYGRELTLSFHGFLRGEEKFTSAEELKEQIINDIAEARKIFK